MTLCECVKDVILCVCDIYVLEGFSILYIVVFFLMIRRPPRSTQSRSSAASDVYKRQELGGKIKLVIALDGIDKVNSYLLENQQNKISQDWLSLIHISEPTRPY